MNYDINISPKVFNDVYRPYLGELARTQIFFGGASSGKSVFLAQRDVLDLLRGGRNFLVCRAVGRTLRGSVYNEVVKIISDWQLEGLFTINKTEMTVTCQNGYQIMFAGLEDVERIKSRTPAKGVLTDVRIEEATEISRNDRIQLGKRLRGREVGVDAPPKRYVMSFNPILQSHHIFQDFFSGLGWADKQKEYRGDGLTILKTTHVDNRFLTAQDRADLENEKDKYFYEVYTLGNWGVLGNVIFTNWEVADLSGLAAQFTNTRNGFDFGFSEDPAALHRSHYDRPRKTVYIFQEWYERGATNDIAAEEIKVIIGTEPLACDSAEPKSIAELRQYGINAYPVAKGKDSVNHGIQWLQQQHIVIDKSCVNTINEFRQYKWREDKNGNAMKQPVDKNDHAISAARYAYERDMVAQWIMD